MGRLTYKVRLCLLNRTQFYYDLEQTRVGSGVERRLLRSPQLRFSQVVAVEGVKPTTLFSRIIFNLVPHQQEGILPAADGLRVKLSTGLLARASDVPPYVAL